MGNLFKKAISLKHQLLPFYLLILLLVFSLTALAYIQGRNDTSLAVTASILLSSFVCLAVVIYRRIHVVDKLINEKQQMLENGQERFNLAMAIKNEGIWDWHIANKALYFDDRYYTLAGYEPGAFAPTFSEAYKRVHPDDLENLINHGKQYTSGESDTFDVEFRFQRNTGNYMWIRARGQIVERDQNNHPVRFVGTHTDITEQKNSQLKLDHLSHYDQLTQLPNRMLMQERLDHAIRRAERRNSHVAVLHLDLDHFKSINDSLGHQMGDELLKGMTHRLKEALRKEDTISRIGGDEFVVILENIKKPNHVIRVLQNMLTHSNKPFVLNAQSLVISPSIGISIFPQDGKDTPTLLKNANTAVSHAKREGRNTFKFYTEELTKEAAERVLLLNDLRQAIAENQLSLVYQPQVDLKSKKLIGVEALLRWQHPAHGQVSPVKFIPLAEESGLIHDIGDWVLDQACKQGKAWLDQGVDFGRVSVNVAGPQIQRAELVISTTKALNESGMPAEHLELEVTETLVMSEASKAIQQLNLLREIGITVAIDDFGTGYSSLSNLKQLPIHKLKIDRSFVMDTPQDSDDVAITTAIVAMGKSLGLTVIAEGVETQEQVTFLSETGCDEAQGYHYSKPVPPEQISDFIKQLESLADTPQRQHS